MLLIFIFGKITNFKQKLKDVRMVKMVDFDTLKSPILREINFEGHNFDIRKFHP